MRKSVAIFLLLFSIVALKAQDSKVENGRVRYAFETKEITQQEAQSLVGKSINLWTYVYFSHEFADQGYITVSDGIVTKSMLRQQSCSQSFSIVDENQDPLSTGGVVKIAPPFGRSCDGHNFYQSGETGFVQNFSFKEACPDWAYMLITDQNNALNTYFEAVEYEGEIWYRAKMYQVTFEYLKAESFYVSFFSGDPRDGIADGASNMNLAYGVSGSYNPLYWGTYQTGGQDWTEGAGLSQVSHPNIEPGIMGFISGGVKIVSGLEGSLSMNKACYGEDVAGVISGLTLPSGDTWKDYTVTYQVKKSAGSVSLNYGTDITLSPDPSTVTSPTYNVTLASAIAKQCVTGDSLIITLTKGESSLRMAAELSFYTHLDLLLAFSDATGSDLVINPIYDKTESSPYSEISVLEGTELVGKVLCSYPTSSNKPGYNEISCYYVKNVQKVSEYLISASELYYSSTPDGVYTSVAEPNTSWVMLTKPFLVKEGYYYIKSTLVEGGCSIYSDTLFVKVKEPLPAPVISISTDCGATLKGLASVDADIKPTEWQWLVTTTKNVNPDPTTSSEYYFSISSGKTGIASDFSTYELSYTVNAAGGNTSELSSTYGSAYNGEFPFCMDVCMLPSTAAGDGVVVSNYPSDPTGLASFKDKVFYVRYKYENEWSPWGANGTLTLSCQVGSDFTFGNNFLSKGISATQCLSSDWTGSDGCSSDTTVEAGSSVVMRMWLDDKGAGFFNPSAGTLSTLQMNVIWQVLRDGQWTTWAVTGYNTMYEGEIKSNGTYSYVESPARVISSTETHRAIISQQGCGFATTDADEGDFSGDDGLDEIGGQSSNGRYADQAVITVQTNAGTVVGSVAGSEYTAGDKTMCFGDALNLKLQDYSASSSATLTWQVSTDGSSDWADVVPTVTGDVYNSVPVSDGDDLYSGRVAYYRVKITDAGKEDYSGSIKVTAYKAKKLSASYMDAQGVTKSSEAGYCKGSVVGFLAYDGEKMISQFPGEGFDKVGFQILSGETPSYDFAEPSTISQWVSDAGQYPSQTLTDKWYTFRVVGNNHGCLSTSEPALVKVNEIPSLGTLTPDRIEVCPGSTQQFQMSGGTVTQYVWTIPNSEAATGAPEVVVPDNTSSQYTAVLPISQAKQEWIMVTGHSVYGSGTDTTICAATGYATAEINIKECTTPAPTPNDTELCPQANDVVLTWADDLDGTWELQDSLASGNSWVKVESTNYTETSITNPSQLTVKSSYFTNATTAAIVHHFRIVKDGVNSLASVAVTVNPNPVITAGDLSITPNPVCVGEKVDFALASVTPEGCTFSWTKDAAPLSGWNTSTQTISSVSEGDAGEYKATINYTDAKGCAATPVEKSASLTVNPLPEKPVVTMKESTLGQLCVGGTATIEADVTNNNSGDFTLEYKWYKESGTLVATTSGPQLTFGPSGADVSTSAPAGSTDYYLVVTVKNNATGCSISSDVPAQKTSVEIITCGESTISDVEACPSDDVKTLTLTYGNPLPTSVEWQVEKTYNNEDWEAAQGSSSCDGPISGTTCTFTPDPKPTQTTRYRAVVTTGGVVSYKVATYTVKAAPNPGLVTVSGYTSALCAGSELTLTAAPATDESGSGVTYSYNWTGPEPFTGSGASLSKTVTEANNGQQYSVEMTATLGTTGCSVTLTGKSDAVTVNPLPADFTINGLDNATVCAGDYHTFTATVEPATVAGGGSYTYNWTVKDKDESLGTEASYEVKALVTETYTLTVTAKTATGCVLTKSKDVTLNVSPKPSLVGAAIAAIPASGKICDGSRFALNTSYTSSEPEGGQFSYVWYHTARTDTAGQAIPGETGGVLDRIASDATMGDYTLRITYTVGSCQTSAVASINVKMADKAVAPSVTIDPASPEVCEGSDITLTASHTETEGQKYSYSWTGPDNFTASTKDATISDATSAKAGDYKVVVTATNETSGCEAVAEEAKATLKVNPLPAEPQISGIDNLSECAGVDVTFTPTVSDGTGTTVEDTYTVTYKWSHGSDSISNTKDLALGKIDDGDKGTYTLQVTFTNKTTGCQSSASKNITLTVNALPVTGGETISGPESPVCEEGEISLTVTPNDKNSGSISYRWYKGATSGAKDKLVGGNSATLTISSASSADAGYYSVVVIYGAGTCTDSVQVRYEQEVTVNPKPAITSLQDETGKTSQSVCINALPETFPSLNLTVASGSVEKWQVNKGSGFVDLEAASTNTTYQIQKADLAIPGTSTFKAIVGNAGCTSVEETYTYTVNDTVDLSGITIADNSSSDWCVETGGNVTLSLSGLNLGTATPTYQWYKDGAAIDGATSATYDVVRSMANNGSYSCKVSLTGSAEDGSCTSQVMVPALAVNFTICDTEDLKPTDPSDPNIEEDQTLVAVCGSEATTSTSSVTYKPTVDAASITKIQWMYYASKPSGSEVGTALGSEITGDQLTGSYVLSAKDVFASIPGKVPGNYYVRAQVTRGTQVSYTSTYQFVFLENATKLSVDPEPDQQTVCLGTEVEFQLIVSKPEAPSVSPDYDGFGLTGITSDNLKYLWTVPSGANKPGESSSSCNAITNAEVVDAEYSAKVVSQFTYTFGASFNKSCPDTSEPAVYQLTVLGKPQIDKFVDAESNTSSVICSSSETYPELTATVSKGSVVRWERKLSTEAESDWKTIATAATNLTYQLVEADVTKPVAKSTEAVVNQYRIVVDNGACDSVTATYTLTVNPVSVAGSITADKEGKYCDISEINVTAADVVNPSGKPLVWTVYNKNEISDDNKVLSQEGASFTYSGDQLTPGNTYYVGYTVPGLDPCGDVNSALVEIKVFAAIAKPTVEISSANVCQGSEVTISVTEVSGLTYKLISSTSPEFAEGTTTEYADGSSAEGKTTFTYTASDPGTVYFKVVATDASYTGDGSCGQAESRSLTLKVDATSEAGTIDFDDPLNSPIEIEVSQTAGMTTVGHTGQLTWIKSSGAEDHDRVWSSLAGSANTHSHTFAAADMDYTYFRVVAKNGVCPADTSNEIKAHVTVGTTPWLEATNPGGNNICITSDVALTVKVPDEVSADFQWNDVQWERRGPKATNSFTDGDAWESTTMEGSLSAVSPNVTQDVEASGSGYYQYRFSYKLSAGGEAAWSNSFTVKVDAASVAGTLTADPDAVCEGSTVLPTLKVTGQTGNITTVLYGTSDSDVSTVKASGGNYPADNIYQVPSQVTNTGYYAIKVKNGVCPEVASAPVQVTIHAKPVAGTIEGNDVLCYNDGTITLSLSGNSGSEINWLQAPSQKGQYASVSTEATYQVGPLADRVWIKAAVAGTDGLCAADTTPVVAVSIYDTLKVTKQPTDVKVVGTGTTATFTVAAATAGLAYKDGSGKFTTVSVKSYQWQKWDGDTWNNLSDGDDYSNVTTATLTVSNAETHAGELYRCVVTSDPCDRQVTSGQATITANAALDPGSTDALTESGCYYEGHEAVYFVKDAAGEGDLTFDWYVNTTTGWKKLSDIPGLNGKYTLNTKGDTVTFTNITDLTSQNITAIKACVKDDNNTECDPSGTGSNFSTEADVCWPPTGKPSYSLTDSLAVCSNAVAPVEYTFNVSDKGSVTNTYKYYYKLPTAPDYTEFSSTTDIPDGSGKNLNVTAADGGITVNSGFDLVFDKLQFKVEVFSSYNTGIDTTLYAVLRVDAPLTITEAATDVVVCEGSDFSFTTGFERANADFQTQVSSQWFYVESGETSKGAGELVMEGNTGSATYNGTAASPADNGTWKVKLGTEVCPASVSDEVELTVKTVPVVDGDITVSGSEVCEGTAITLTAEITEGATPTTYKVVWQKENGADNWVDVDVTGNTDSIEVNSTTGSSANSVLSLKKGSAKDAGKYRVVVEVTEASLGECTGKQSMAEAEVHIKIAPVVKLSPEGNVFAKEGASTTVNTQIVDVASLGYDPAYVSMDAITKYQWFIQLPGKDSYTEFTDAASQFTDFITSQPDASSISFNGVMDNDSTLFYVTVTGGCGTHTTAADTLRVNNKFGISGVDVAGNPVCTNDEDAAFTVTVRTNIPAQDDAINWEVSTDAGTSWNPVAAGDVPGQTGASYAFDNSVPSTYKLIVNRPTLAMNGWKYRLSITDGTDSDNTEAHREIVLQVLQPVAFTCADDQVLSKTEPVVVVGGVPASSVLTANVECLPGSAPDFNGYTLGFWQMAPKESSYTQVSTGNSNEYTFSSAADSGMYNFMFVMSNVCGADTAYDSVMAIKPILPDTDGDGGSNVAIEKQPEDPADPDVTPGEEVERVESQPDVNDGNIEITVCEDRQLALVAPYTGGPVFSDKWQVKTSSGGEFSDLTIVYPYSLKGDTLLINPVATDIEGYVFRRYFDMPGNVKDTVSKTITVHVNQLPDITGVTVEVTDVTTTPALEPGQAKPGSTLKLTAKNTESLVGVTKYCFYQVVPGKDTIELTSVGGSNTNCSASNEITFTDKATVADHDSTLYMVRVYNECGFSESPLALLRVFDTLVVDWIPDTIVKPTPGSDWTIDSMTDYKVGDLIVEQSPMPGDETTVAAYMFACEETVIVLSDTTVRGFRNPNGTGGKNPSFWQFRTDTLQPWKELRVDDPQFGGINIEIDEETGTASFQVGTAMNGWQFRGVGVNDLYSDTTMPLTLFVLPVLEEGDLVLTPNEFLFCGEGEAEFVLSEVSGADLSKFDIQWEVDSNSTNQWVVVPQLKDSLRFDVGLVDTSYNNFKVRAVVSSQCAEDTVEGIIKVSTPLAPSVVLSGVDTLCLGDTLRWVATPHNGGTAPEYVWSLNGKELDTVDGNVLTLPDMPAGTYEIHVKMLADASDACIYPEQAEADTVVFIMSPASILAHAADSSLKVGESTYLWVESDSAMESILWTPAQWLETDTEDTVNTLPFTRPGEFDFVVEVSTSYGCISTDTVTVEVQSNLVLDSIGTDNITPPAKPNQGGEYPGFPEDGFDFDLDRGWPSLTFYGDTAEIWVCPGNQALINLAFSGNEDDLTYTWTHSGTASLVYPADAQVGKPYTTPDSIFVFFFPDSTTRELNCQVEDAYGTTIDVVILVNYYQPQMTYIEVNPKVTTGKYFTNQAVYFHAKPKRYEEYHWMKVLSGTVVDEQLGNKDVLATSFELPAEEDNEIWLSVVDENGCRIWDSVHVNLLEMPNVMILNDPSRAVEGVIFPEFQVEVTNTWGLCVKTFEQRNGNGSNKGWDGRTPSGTFVQAGTYYYRVKIPTLDGFTIVKGAVTVINK